VWSLKALQPEIATCGGRLRQHLIGVADPLARRIHMAFSDKLKAQQFQHFLERLLLR